MQAQGLNQTSISRRLKLQQPTVSRVENKFQIHHTVQDLPRSGRKSVFSEHDEQEMAILCKRENISDGFKGLHRKIQAEWGVDCSTNTVTKAAKHADLCSYVLRKKPLLTKSHIAQWLDFAKAMLLEPAEELHNIVFTDCHTIYFCAGGHKKRILKPKGSDFNFDRMEPTLSHGGGGVKFWAAISYHRIIAYEFIAKAFDS